MKFRELPSMLDKLKTLHSEVFFQYSLGTISGIFKFRREARIKRGRMGTIISISHTHSHSDTRVIHVGNNYSLSIMWWCKKKRSLIIHCIATRARPTRAIPRETPRAIPEKIHHNLVPFIPFHPFLPFRPDKSRVRAVLFSIVPTFIPST